MVIDCSSLTKRRGAPRDSVERSSVYLLYCLHQCCASLPEQNSSAAAEKKSETEAKKARRGYRPRPI